MVTSTLNPGSNPAAGLERFDVHSAIDLEAENRARIEKGEPPLQLPFLNSSRRANLRDPSYKLMYYRKPPKEDGTPGDITWAGGWADEYVKLEQMGYTPLPKYGTFQAQNKAEPGGSWSHSQDPYRRILRAGGAHEFHWTQILEQGWHRKAPFGVKFPQLEQAKNEIAANGYADVRCTRCRRVFMRQEDLEKHSSIRHKDTAANEQLGTIIAAASKSGEGPIAVLIEKTIESQQRLEERIAEISARNARTDQVIAALLEKMTAEPQTKATKAAVAAA